MAERRKHHRLKKRLELMWGENDLDQRGFARDVSVGGLFLDTRKLADIGTRLHLHIMDPNRDFYVEAEVVRQRRVDARLRTLEKEGVGLRFLLPSELVMGAVPSEERTRETNTVVCADGPAVRTLLGEQIYSRILVVPVGNPPPSAGTVVEFEIRVEIGEGQSIEGQGRVVQVLGAEGEARTAVLEVQDVERVRAALEGVMASA